MKFQNVRAILADIGVSSLQIDKDDRGFSIGSNTLDMRMDKERGFSAYDVANDYSFDELVRIFRDYGELKNAAGVANKIINARNFRQGNERKRASKFDRHCTDKRARY